MSRRWVRLHAERLEDRLMMAADAPLDVGAASLFSSDSTPVSMAADATGVNIEAPIVGQSAAWEWFQSADELEAWLVEAAVAQWGHLFGQPAYYPSWDWGLPSIGGEIVLLGTAAPTMELDATDGTFSSTHVQVDGVDEADLVETDGDYLYIISGEDLVIVQAGVGEELRVVSRLRLDERAVGMYLSGDRLTIVSSPMPAAESVSNQLTTMRLFAPLDEAYQQASARPTTTVTVLDLTDRAAPTLVQKTQLDGQLVTSRVVDGQLRLLVSNEIHLPPPIVVGTGGELQGDPTEPVLAPPGDDFSKPVEVQPVEPTDEFRVLPQVIGIGYWEPIDSEQFYETQEEYLARVREEILSSIRLNIRGLALDGTVISETPLFEATDLLRPQSLFDRYITTIATFDLAGDTTGPVSNASLITGGVPQVYSTANNMYLFAEDSHPAAGPKSTVWKFAFDAETHAIDLAAKGLIDGALLNQFAADEHDGYLRVVTATSWDLSGHSVFVLEQVGQQLQLVGSLTGIAAGENLYSVRFAGERAFFVTFRVVDPLFAVDLADPTDPKLLGELHIPGYSDYLQPIDGDRLLAIGRGADEVTGLFQELQVSIFDVSNMSDPQLLHRYSFGGGRSTVTPATGDPWVRGDGDHHAISYFADEQIFALPVSSVDEMDWWWDGQDGAPLLESGHGGLQVFRIDVDTGFTPLALIEHSMPIERSVRVGDRLFAISGAMVSVHELLNPTVQLGEVSIGVELTEQWVELTMHQPPIEIVTAASDAVVDAAIPEVGWFLPLQRSRQLSTSRIAAFSVLPASYRSNAEVIQLLASANATNHRLGKASVLDDLTDELFQVDETWDDEVVPVEDGLHPSWIAHLRPVLQSGPSRR